jgi:hypothetical protein
VRELPDRALEPDPEPSEPDPPESVELDEVEVPALPLEPVLPLEPAPAAAPELLALDPPSPPDFERPPDESLEPLPPPSDADESLEPLPPPSDPDDPLAPSLTASDFLALVERRSTFAQPVPLNTIAGGANALRIDAPQTGHERVVSSWTPWRISVLWPLGHT